jgi:hypothetical protein
METSTQNDEVFRQGIRAWQTAVEAGAKMQEEGSKWFRQMFSEAGSLNDWYNKSQGATSDMMAKAQENIDEAIRLVNQNAESGVKLIQKLLDGRQSQSRSEAHASAAEWWETAVETALMNTQAGLQANSRILSAWSELAKRVNGDVADKMAEQADKVARSAADRVKEMATPAPGNNGG